ncbi:MAG: septum site-determining protein MinD [Clostridiales bacterium]|nr:septum site-determining protein MinD [Clostridiales bacterium]
MARKIVITSGKGGVGKTTIVSNLGVMLAQQGYRTLLVDMDFGLNNLDVLMGVENKIVYDIIDVIEGKCTPKQAIIQDFFESELYILPSSHSFCSVKFGSAILCKIISMVEDSFDFVLIDCPAGIDGGFRRAIECAQEYIVVTTPHLSAIRDAVKVINYLKGVSRDMPNIIINRARGDLMLSGDSLNLDAMRECLYGNIIGVIPDDDVIAHQVFWGGQIDKNSEVRQSLYLIVRNLISGDEKVFDCTSKYRGLVGSIRKKLRRRV